jgi:hypothetical protein
MVIINLKSHWGESKCRDRQREVAEDKGRWGFVLQGMRPAAAQAAKWWQGAIAITHYYCFPHSKFSKVLSQLVHYKQAPVTIGYLNCSLSNSLVPIFFNILATLI